MSSGQGKITRLLQVWSRGERGALDELAPLVHAELRKLARFHMSREAAGHTLQPTALINEAYLKFVDIHETSWRDRKHFYAAASQIMRRILIDHARKKRSVKRGRELKRVPWEDALTVTVESHGGTDVLALDEALNRLEAVDGRKARVMEFWFFTGMTVEEIANTMDIGTATVQRDLEFSKVWLARELGRMEGHEQ